MKHEGVTVTVLRCREEFGRLVVLSWPGVTVISHHAAVHGMILGTPLSLLTGAPEMGYVYALALHYCCNNNVLSNGDAPWQRPLRCPGSNRMALFLV
jgi:hypothetical protein